MKIELFDRNSLELVESKFDGKWRLWGKSPVENYNSEWVCFGVYDRKKDCDFSKFEIKILPRPQVPEEYQ